MKKSGGFFVSGIVAGISDSINSANSEVEAMAKKMTDTADNIFSGYEIPNIISDLDLSSTIQRDIESGFNAERRKDLENKDDETPVAVTVKIGEETILDRIIDGLNDKAFLTNAGVVTV